MFPRRFRMVVPAWLAAGFAALARTIPQLGQDDARDADLVLAHWQVQPCLQWDLTCPKLLRSFPKNLLDFKNNCEGEGRFFSVASRVCWVFLGRCLRHSVRLFGERFGLGSCTDGVYTITVHDVTLCSVGLILKSTDADLHSSTFEELMLGVFPVNPHRSLWGFDQECPDIHWVGYQRQSHSATWRLCWWLALGHEEGFSKLHQDRRCQLWLLAVCVAMGEAFHLDSNWLFMIILVFV